MTSQGSHSCEWVELEFKPKSFHFRAHILFNIYSAFSISRFQNEDYSGPLPRALPPQYRCQIKDFTGKCGSCGEIKSADMMESLSSNLRPDRVG